MIAWILGIDLKSIEMIIGAGFLLILVLLIYISYEVHLIKEDEDKRLK